MSVNRTTCEHLKHLKLLQAARYECEQCVLTGDTWVHLRTCQTCGHVHCCDDSKNKHATKHYLASGHPVVTSAEPGERWAWCYADNSFATY